MKSSDLVYSFLLISPLLLVSLVLHELAHGWVAWKLGDPTAKLHGRLTLNPLKHLDLWGTVMLAVTFFGSASAAAAGIGNGPFLFGWAKPVPINPWRFKNPQRGMMLVGLAGPAANLTMALMAAGLVWLTYDWSLFLGDAFSMLFALNVILMTFNLVPIPPLDGSRVLGGLLPPKTYLRWLALDRYGTYVFLALLMVMILAPAVFQSTIGAVLQWSFHLLPGG